MTARTPLGAHRKRTVPPIPPDTPGRLEWLADVGRRITEDVELLVPQLRSEGLTSREILRRVMRSASSMSDSVLFAVSVLARCVIDEDDLW